MTLMTANRLEKSYGEKICFRDVSFAIHAGARIGLIGPNGCGKTTLFRVVSGEEESEGELSRRRGLEIARLEQTPVFPGGATPRDLLAEAIRPWRELDEDIEALREELATAKPKEHTAILRRLERLEARREAGNGEAASRRAETVFHGVGLALERLDQEVSTLSGGERCRVALARLLLLDPDVWLLDEPTNHLDISGIEFLERFVRAAVAAVLIVSHDRRFLDETIDEIWELEGGRLYRYRGNYSKSRMLREARRRDQWRLFMRQREFRRREEAFIDKWRAGTRSRQAQSRLKRLARLESIEEPGDQSRLAALDLRLGRRLGDLVLDVPDLEIGFPGRSLSTRLRFQLEPGEVLGVVGPNGSGKSTLLQTFLGAVPPLAGTFRWGPTAEVGHLGQHDTFPDESETPLRYLQDANLGTDDQDRRDKLGAMLFSGDEAMKPIHTLSGGEKKRLMLTRLILNGDNVLLLDEPTNHLDIDSAEAVTLALSAYPGSVIAASHDRRFLDDLADRILWLEDGDWRMTRGGFSQAEAERDRLRGEEAARRRQAAKDAPVPGRRERRDAAKRCGAASDSPFAGWSVARLEKRIIESEDRLAGIHAAFADPTVVRNGGRMRELRKELAAIEKELALLEEEYARRG